MRYIAITMMRVHDPCRDEWRDTIDSRWLSFIRACGYTPIYIPNNAELCRDLLVNIKPIGIILSGGGDCVAISGVLSERDKTEKTIIEIAVEFNIPLLGICRGMQVLFGFYGVNPTGVVNHKCVKHPVVINGSEFNVNSFHNYGFFRAPSNFDVICSSADGVIECAVDKGKHFYTIMWHPERESPFKELDINLMKELFGV
jgi:N5-(cytidine 5'-diphosphoramidyl)-L-glutamine hydrolase